MQDLTTIVQKLTPKYLAGIDFLSERAQREFMQEALEVIFMNLRTSLEQIVLENVDTRDPQALKNFIQEQVSKNDTFPAQLDAAIEKYKADFANEKQKALMLEQSQ